MISKGKTLFIFAIFFVFLFSSFISVNGQVCTVPICSDGSQPIDTGQVDYNNCTIYSCPLQACSMPVCNDGSQPIDTGKVDSNNCPIFQCGSVGCLIPICSDGSNPIDTGKVDYNNCKIYSCPVLQCSSGCATNETCYPIGYRIEGQFCSDRKNFVPQLEPDSSCQNNFECSSNMCVNSQCVSGSLIQRIFDWFRRLFGLA